MPKKSTMNSFFLRHTTNIGNTNAFAYEDIDLGAYVDALGESILKIWNIAVTFSDSTGRSSEVSTEAAAQFQLTTSLPADIVLPSDRSLIASGRIVTDGAGGMPTYISHDNDVLPQMWEHGYLVAVPELYLGGAASDGYDGNVYVSIVMECTVEKLTKSAGLALALSQS